MQIQVVATKLTNTRPAVRSLLTSDFLCSSRGLRPAKILLPSKADPPASGTDRGRNEPSGCGLTNLILIRFDHFFVYHGFPGTDDKKIGSPGLTGK